MDDRYSYSRRIESALRFPVARLDLQGIESRAVELEDARARQRVAVGDDGGDDPVLADSRDNEVGVRVEEGFSRKLGAPDRREHPLSTPDVLQYAGTQDQAAWPTATTTTPS